MQLGAALRDTLEGWQADLHPPWRDVVGDVTLAVGDVDSTLEIEPWEPIFPARRGRRFPGTPAGAHLLRAFIQTIIAARTGEACYARSFADAAAETLAAAVLSESDAGTDPRVILRAHPAEADAFLALENPFTLCNRHLRTMGAAAVDW